MTPSATSATRSLRAALRIGVVGCAGRMGRLLVREIRATEGCAVGGGCARPGSAAVGEDVAQQAGLAAAGLAVTDDAEAMFRRCDVAIDYSVASVAPRSAALAARLGVPLVLGTTGIASADQERIAEAARRVAIVQSANASVGMNVLLSLVEQTAAVLGADYDIEILGQQHRAKVDAPSGSALALGRAAATGRGVPLAEVAIRARSGDIGPRPAGAIGLATVSGGDLSVIHTVLFAGAGERIELSHKGFSRALYTAGAVKAARWAHARPPGLYSMLDVLGLR